MLDAGAGRLAFRDVLAPFAKHYVSADLADARSQLDVVCDLGEPPFRTGAFDTVFCIQVLEHTPQPRRVLQGLRRCSRTTARSWSRVPHIAYLHGEPHDYFRYTKYGLTSMLESTGFEVLAMQPIGGLLGFVATLGSDVALTGLSRVPAVFPAAFAVNRAIVRLVCGIERRLGEAALPNALFAMDYAAVARKRAAVPPHDATIADLS